MFDNAPLNSAAKPSFLMIFIAQSAEFCKWYFSVILQSFVAPILCKTTTEASKHEVARKYSTRHSVCFVYAKLRSELKCYRISTAEFCTFKTPTLHWISKCSPFTAQYGCYFSTGETMRNFYIHKWVTTELTSSLELLVMETMFNCVIFGCPFTVGVFGSKSCDKWESRTVSYHWV